MFRSENTVPKTSFASSSLERPLRAGLPSPPAPPVVGPGPAEEGLLVLFVLVILEALLLET